MNSKDTEDVMCHKYNMKSKFLAYTYDITTPRVFRLGLHDLDGRTNNR